MNAFGQALMTLMVEHGVASVRPRAGSGLLGLTESGTFETSDLSFEFLAPADHRAAVAALVAALAALGHDTPALRSLDPEPVLGHGRPAGRVIADPDFAASLHAGLR